MKAARASEEKASRSVWLHAWHDPVAGLKAFTPSVRMCDLSGDGECKLLVASSDKKLKIYTGTTLLSENVLLDAPVLMVSTSTRLPSPPELAVAAVCEPPMNSNSARTSPKTSCTHARSGYTMPGSKVCASPPVSSAMMCDLFVEPRSSTVHCSARVPTTMSA